MSLVRDGWGGSKTGKFLKQKEPKINFVANNTRGLKTTKQRPVEYRYEISMKERVENNNRGVGHIFLCFCVG